MTTKLEKTIVGTLIGLFTYIYIYIYILVLK